MARGGLFSAFKGFDAFGKTMEDVKIKTRTGALLTMLSVAIICTFTLIEFIDYRKTYVDTSVIVDRSRGEKLVVNMNITFPQVPCYLLSMDVMDISGEHQNDVDHTMLKTRLDNQMQKIPDATISQELKSELEKVAKARGEGYCGSCYGGQEPEGGCCNTCDSVREAYLNRGWSFANPDAIDQCVAEHWTEKIHDQATEGCNIAGKVTVNKVIGNFHFSPGRSYLLPHMNVQELVPYVKDGIKHGFGHIIHQLSFENEKHIYGENLTKEMKRKLGIVFQPLDTSGSFNPQANYMYQYFLKVVATRYSFLDRSFASTYQYSVTTYERDLAIGGAAGKNAQGLMTSHGILGIPGVFINYEISPMVVDHHERRQSFAHFLTSMCAIVGGVLTVASILDSAMFRGQKIIKKKADSASTAPSIQERSGLMNLQPRSGYGGNYGSSVKMM
ncbi:hypothetical protein FRB94_002678 [Tulasnella sp. JGI-2019a]|nr:hypothetical protein FRB93_002092 [Tulasnella sp. JGI-2019a]KAG9004087.1 hypothetical protein FRB94_002678 [Tulasnella sp. JGI-2019a]KAG9031383.1 hypothetical protein FRB95_002814 [Tulasnella sp. JGI-2019a]